jgi:hypothetical protein
LSLKPPLPHSICELRSETSARKSWKIVRVLSCSSPNLGYVFRTPILTDFHA